MISLGGQTIFKIKKKREREREREKHIFKEMVESGDTRGKSAVWNKQIM